MRRCEFKNRNSHQSPFLSLEGSLCLFSSLRILSLSLSLYLHLPFSFPIYLYLSLSRCRPLSISIPLCLSISLFLAISISLRQTLTLTLFPFLPHYFFLHYCYRSHITTGARPTSTMYLQMYGAGSRGSIGTYLSPCIYEYV